MKRLTVGLLCATLTLTPCEPVFAWAHANVYGGGSAHQEGSDTATHKSADGTTGTATHTSQGTSYTNSNGASASHAEGANKYVANFDSPVTATEGSSWLANLWGQRGPRRILPLISGLSLKAGFWQVNEILSPGQQKKRGDGFHFPLRIMNPNELQRAQKVALLPEL